MLIQASLHRKKEHSSVCICVGVYLNGVCAAAERGQTVFFFHTHTRSVDSFTHHCGEHTDTLIRIWALSAASATVQQSNVGIKGVSHQSRAERLQFVTCEHSPLMQFGFSEEKLWLKVFFVALAIKFYVR